MTHRMIRRSTLILTAAAITLVTAACHKTGTMNTAAKPANGLPAGVTAMMVAQGDSLFHARSCRNCHGMDAKGARGGPDLTSGDYMHVSGSYDDFVKIITSGIPREEIKDTTHHNPMPARGGARPAPLTDDQIRDVAAYVYSLSRK
ncbi:MAG: c-type cytochrome [Gemmatimonadales bacterium]